MKRLLTSCFGLGWLPAAPGSWGSLPPAIAFGLIYYLGGGGILAFAVMAAFFIAGSIICVKLSGAAVDATGKEDPNEVVVDEIAGQALSFMAIPFLNNSELAVRQIVTISVLGYFLFRLFDTIKPWPCYRFERFHGGWGILADDLMAGTYACVWLAVIAKLWILQ